MSIGEKLIIALFAVGLAMFIAGNLLRVTEANGYELEQECVTIADTTKHNLDHLMSDYDPPIVAEFAEFRVLDGVDAVSWARTTGWEGTVHQVRIYTVHGIGIASNITWVILMVDGCSVGETVMSVHLVIEVLFKVDKDGGV